MQKIKGIHHGVRAPTFVTNSSTCSRLHIDDNLDCIPDCYVDNNLGITLPNIYLDHNWGLILDCMMDNNWDCISNICLDHNIGHSKLYHG